MRVVRFAKDLRLRTVVAGASIPMEFKAGEEYIMSDPYVFDFEMNHGSEVMEYAYPIETVFGNRYKGEPLDGKTLIVWRTGGIGDLMFLTPALRWLKKQYPTCKITAATAPQNVDILFGNPSIDQTLLLPLKADVLRTSDYYQFFEGLIENNSHAQVMNAYDLFMEALSIDSSKVPQEEKIPFVARNEIFRQKMINRFFPGGKSDILTIGIQVASSTPVRDWPSERVEYLAQLYIDRGYLPVFLGSKKEQIVVGQFRLKGKFITTAGETTSLQELIGVMELCDLIVAPDSSVTHIAAALGKPLIGLYGAFPPLLRMAYYPNATSIFGLVSGKCNDRGWPDSGRPNGCFLHSGKPCRQSLQSDGKSPCMLLIEPKYVAEITDRIVERLNL